MAGVALPSLESALKLFGREDGGWKRNEIRITNSLQRRPAVGDAVSPFFRHLFFCLTLSVYDLMTSFAERDLFFLISNLNFLAANLWSPPATSTLGEMGTESLSAESWHGSNRDFEAAGKKLGTKKSGLHFHRMSPKQSRGREGKHDTVAETRSRLAKQGKVCENIGSEREKESKKVCAS